MMSGESGEPPHARAHDGTQQGHQVGPPALSVIKIVGKSRFYDGPHSSPHYSVHCEVSVQCVERFYGFHDRNSSFFVCLSNTAEFVKL